MGAPSRRPRAGSRVRSELTTPHQRHQLGLAGSAGTPAPGPTEYDVAVAAVNAPAASIPAARLPTLSQLVAMHAPNGMRDTTFVTVGPGATPNVGDTDTITFRNARLRPTK